MVYVNPEFLVKKELEITGKRFCTQCQRAQFAEGGQKRGSRWVCANCVDRRKNKIMSNVYGKKK